MKVTLLLLCGLGLSVADSNNNYNYKQADKQFLQKQQDLLELFFNLQQPTIIERQRQQANSFSFKKQQQNSNNPDAVYEYQYAFEFGLSRGEVFNYFNPIHHKQAIQLFDVFYFAKDYNTFYEAACWARNNVNGGLFAYAISVAILNRPDTQGVALPPQAEVFPYLYINSRAVQQAQFNKQQGQKESYVQSNNTNVYFDSYFPEDINLNQQFAYEQLKNPSWFGGEKYQQSKKQNGNQNDGENYFYYLQQTLARYNLERYSHGLTPTRPFLLSKPIYPGYNSQLQYFNGQSQPARPNDYSPYNSNSKLRREFQNIDRRLADAVDSNQALAADGSKVQLNADNGVQVLGNIVQNNQDSVNNQFYGANNGQYGYFEQCRAVVGSVVDPQNQFNNGPSAMENDNTANRDPAFYQCLTRVVEYFQSFNNQQKPYTKDQLNFQGVKVQNVKIDKLVTYLDSAEVDLFNAINYNQGEKPDEYKFKAQQLQLNNKPFTYQIQVESDKETNAIVRVFIGPKYDSQEQPKSLYDFRKGFVEIDRFTANLKNGQNQIQRNSRESTRFVQQQPNSIRQLYKQVQQARQGGQTFYYNQNVNQQQATFPQNLILPKGSETGNEYVLAVVVNSNQGNSQSQDQQDQPQDNRPQGFPFDRQVRELNFYQVKNIYFQTIKIFNKNQEEINNIY